jgi:lipopolysaccharide transport system ATP-binding protein
VAAHLEPEILICDEVLAVGDVEFQKKCLGKMQHVSRGGRTVLFVSHNISAVSELCGSVVLLEKGRVAAKGPTEAMLSLYMLSDLNQTGFVDFRQLSASKKRQRQIKPAFFLSASVLDNKGKVAASFDFKDGFSVELIYEVPKPLEHLEVAVRILTHDFCPIMTTMLSEVLPDFLAKPQQGVFKTKVSWPGNFFMPGTFLITIAVYEPQGQLYDVHDAVFRITIEDTGTIFSKYKMNHLIGVITKPLEWQAGLAR